MTSTPDFTWLFLKMLVGLVIVLGLAVFLIRYLLPKTRLGRRKGNQWMVLVDRLSIEPRKGVYLVKILERYFVLGITEQSVNLITELSKSEGETIENK